MAMNYELLSNLATMIAYITGQLFVMLPAHINQFCIIYPLYFNNNVIAFGLFMVINCKNDNDETQE